MDSTRPASSAQAHPSTVALIAIYNVRHPLIGPIEKAIMFAFAATLNDDGIGWPTYDAIAVGSGACHNSVSSVMPWLKKVGILVVGSYARGYYRIDVDRLRNLPFDLPPRTTGERKSKPSKARAACRGADLQQVFWSDRKIVGKIRRLAIGWLPFIKERDAGKCRYCGTASGVLCLDHVVPVAQGGSNDPKNLVLSCRSCNSRKRGMTPAQAGMVLVPVGGAS